MKLLIFKEEQFSEGGFSNQFKSVKEALVQSGIIMSCEASNEVYRAIFEAGVSSVLESQEKLDASYIEKGWKLIQEGL